LSRLGKRARYPTEGMETEAMGIIVETEAMGIIVEVEAMEMVAEVEAMEIIAEVEIVEAIEGETEEEMEDTEEEVAEATEEGMGEEAAPTGMGMGVTKGETTEAAIVKEVKEIKEVRDIKEGEDTKVHHRMDHPPTKTREGRPGMSEQFRQGETKTRTETSTPTKAIGMARARDDPRILHLDPQLASQGQMDHPKGTKVRTSPILEIRDPPTMEMVGMQATAMAEGTSAKEMVAGLVPKDKIIR
jgi:hypothetical protein